MKLSATDAAIFFELMKNLQIYANQQLQGESSVKNAGAYEAQPIEERAKIRDALYANPELIDRFVTENPQGFSAEKLDIVRQWKNFVAGDFYIERILKKYTVFISSKDERVYAVLGLWDGFEDMIHTSHLPMLVSAVLLPFKGRIVYDGMLKAANIYFGSGLADDLKEVYLAAKQSGQIIESLDPSAQPTKAQTSPAQLGKDWSPLMEELAQQAKSLRGGNGQPPLNSPVFSLIKASLELGQLAVNDPDDFTQLEKALEKVERSLRKAETTLYRHWR